MLKGFDPLLNLVLDGTIEYMRGKANSFYNEWDFVGSACRNKQFLPLCFLPSHCIKCNSAIVCHNQICHINAIITSLSSSSHFIRAEEKKHILFYMSHEGTSWVLGDIHFSCVWEKTDQVVWSGWGCCHCPGREIIAFCDTRMGLWDIFPPFSKNTMQT